VRRLTWDNDFEYITDARRTRLEDRTYTGTFGIEFNSSDQITAAITSRYERLPADFSIAPGVIVPGGGYDSATVTGTYILAQQRKVSGSVSVSNGGFYEGTKTTARRGLKRENDRSPGVGGETRTSR